MAVGYQVTRAAIDQRAGSTVVAVEAALDDARRMKAWLDTQVDADLVTLGYTSGEVAVLKSSFTDLDNLRQTAYGLRAQPTAASAFAFAGRLRGIL